MLENIIIQNPFNSFINLIDLTERFKIKRIYVPGNAKELEFHKGYILRKNVINTKFAN